MPTTAFQHSLSRVGYTPDLAYNDRPAQAWDAGYNVEFTRGAPRTARGMEMAYTATTTVVHAVNTFTSTANFWAYATLTALYATDGGTTANITRVSSSSTFIAYSASADEGWVSTAFGNYLVLTNGFDKPQSWSLSLSDQAQDLPNWPADWIAKSVRAYKNYLVAMDITIGSTRYPSLLAWSDAASYDLLPNTWVPATTNDAGDNALNDTPGFIVDGLVLGDSFFIYKEDAVWAMTYTPTAEVMRFQKVFSGVGLFTRNCVVEFDNMHFFVGRGDVYVHNGVSLKSIATERVKEALFSSINSATYTRTFVAIDRNAREIWICYPNGSDWPNEALIWNYETNVWYPPRQLLQTAHISSGIISVLGATSTFDGSAGVSFDSDTGPFDARLYNPTKTRLLACVPEKDYLYAVNSSAGIDGVSFVSSLTQKLLPFDGQDMQGPVIWTPQVKLVRRVWVEAKGTGTIRVYVGTQDHEPEDPVWNGPFNLNLATQNFVWTFVRGRYISLRFESDSSDTEWELTGYKIDWEPAGDR